MNRDTLINQWQLLPVSGLVCAVEKTLVAAIILARNTQPLARRVTQKSFVGFYCKEYNEIPHGLFNTITNLICRLILLFSPLQR